MESAILPHMTTLHPWINFNGNAEEAFTFYKSVFGGEFSKVTRFKDLASADFQVPADEAEKIMQIILPIGPHTMLIANDIPSFMGKVNEQENRSKIVVRTDTKEQADTFFQGLSVGGQVEYPMGQSPFGTYFGSFRDKFGIEWVIECAG